MTTDEIRFREYLAWYGPDISSWPETARPFGQHMQHYPECAALLEAEKRFGYLLHERRFEPAHAELAARILAAASTRVRAPKPKWWLFDRASGLSPAAFAATLILGFAIGFAAMPSLSHSPQRASLQAYSDDDGAIL